MYIYMYVYIYVYVYIYYVYIYYVYIYIHTHTHIYTYIYRQERYTTSTNDRISRDYTDGNGLYPDDLTPVTLSEIADAMCIASGIAVHGARATGCASSDGLPRLRSTLHRSRSGLGRRPRPSKPLSSSRRRGGRATTSRAAGVASPSPDRRLTPRGPPCPWQGRCSARRRRRRASRPS